MSECPAEQSLPGAPNAKARKQKPGDESTAPKRQKAAGGKAAAAVATAASGAGASSSTDPRAVDLASSTSEPPLSDAGFGGAFSAPPPAVSGADLFGSTLDQGSHTLDDDGDDYDAE